MKFTEMSPEPILLGNMENNGKFYLIMKNGLFW